MCFACYDIFIYKNNFVSLKKFMLETYYGERKKKLKNVSEPTRYVGVV